MTSPRQWECRSGRGSPRNAGRISRTRDNRLPTRMRQRVVLIGRQQAFAAPGRAQHQEAPAAQGPARALASIKLSARIADAGCRHRASRPRRRRRSGGGTPSAIRRFGKTRQGGHHVLEALRIRRFFGIGRQQQGVVGAKFQERAHADDTERRFATPIGDDKMAVLCARKSVSASKHEGIRRRAGHIARTSASAQVVSVLRARPPDGRGRGR